MTSTNTPTPLRQRMIDDMRARNLGSHSQRSHIASCKRFAAWLGRCPGTATADEVKAFQLHLIESGASICNRNRIVTGVKFLFRVTLRRHDLAAEIYHLREPQKAPLVLGQDEVKRLLAMASSTKVQAMLSLSYGCGLRAGEVVRLKAGDIDSDQKIIRIVQAKGRKDRHVMLPDDVVVLLRAWWRERRACRHDAKVPPQGRYLFPGRGSRKHLSTRQYPRLFRKTVAAAGIKKPITLHTLRHSFATHLVERGVDIRKIQALLGHHKLETTARYARVATGMIAEIASPLEGLKPERSRRSKKDLTHSVHAPLRFGGCGHFPRLRSRMASCQSGTDLARTDEGQLGHRALPDGGARRARG